MAINMQMNKDHYKGGCYSHLYNGPLKYIDERAELHCCAIAVLPQITNLLQLLHIE